MEPKEKRKRLRWLNEIDYLLLHMSPLLIFWTGATWFDWILCISLYFFRMFFITAGYHRYFSHKTFKTSRAFQFVLAWFAQSSLQKGALWWASNHRVHHKHSDTPKDPHSANLYGFWYAHMGWIMAPEFKGTQYDLIRDFTRFKELVWLNRHHWLPGVALLLTVYFLGNWVNGTGITDWTAGLSTVACGFLLSTVALYHGTFTINSLMHKIGRPRYKTDDHSKNSFWLALITMGEGWHNNHHYFQAAARQGFFWWELDMTYYIIKMLSWVGIVWDIRKVPKRVKYAYLDAGE